MSKAYTLLFGVKIKQFIQVFITVHIIKLLHACSIFTRYQICLISQSHCCPLVLQCIRSINAYNVLAMLFRTVDLYFPLLPNVSVMMSSQSATLNHTKSQSRQCIAVQLLLALYNVMPMYFTIMPRLHLIHVSRIQVVSTCIYLYRLSPSTCILYWRHLVVTATCIHVSTCVRIQVACPGYMYLV